MTSSSSSLPSFACLAGVVGEEVAAGSPSSTASSSTASSATSSSATGSSATGSSTIGSSATDSSATGSSATGSSATCALLLSIAADAEHHMRKFDFWTPYDG